MGRVGCSLFISVSGVRLVCTRSAIPRVVGRVVGGQGIDLPVSIAGVGLGVVRQRWFPVRGIFRVWSIFFVCRVGRTMPS